MPKNVGPTVLFLDTNGVGFSQNLVALRDEILRRGTPVRLRYHFCNLSQMADAQLQNATASVTSACADADIIVCATDSLPEQLDGPTSGQRRVLLHPPRQTMITGRPPKERRALAYTDVVVQNERYAQYIRTLYALPDSSCVRSLGLPAIDLFLQPKAVALRRRRAIDLCPQAEGRRIVVLASHYDAQAILGAVDLETMAERLADEYFLVISAPQIGRVLAGYDASLSRFAFAPYKTLSTFDLLYAADALVCTRFTDAVYYAASGRPLLYLHPTRSRIPDELVGLRLEDLTHLPESLHNLDPQTIDPFRDAYVAPNTKGNAARILSHILDGG